MVDFEREFAVAPRIRAALHAGTLIAGEVAGNRHSIIFHGDPVNTATRLEQLARELDLAPVRVSSITLE